MGNRQRSSESYSFELLKIGSPHQGKNFDFPGGEISNVGGHFQPLERDEKKSLFLQHYSGATRFASFFFGVACFDIFQQ